MASSAPPAGCVARPATVDDIPALVALFVRRDEGLGIQPEPVGAFLQWMFGLPYVRLERDTVVLEREGAVVGSLTAFRDPASPGAALHSEGAVDPSMRGRGLGSWFISWLDAAARGRSDELPFDLHTLCPAADAAGAMLLRAAGFDLVRRSWEMAIDLSVPRPPLGTPPGVALRTFEVGRDERTFWQIHETAFEGHFGFTPSPFESWEGEWYRSDSWDASRVVFAEVDGETVGVAGWVDADTDGYVADVSVLPAHRRRGLAGAMLRRLFDDIERAGKQRATLTVDSENAHGAVGLYEGAGMHAYREWHVYGRRIA